MQAEHHSGSEPRRPAGDHHGSHGGHEDHAEMFRRRFWVSLALTVPTVVYSGMVQEWLGYTAPEFPGSTVRARRCSARPCSSGAVPSSCAAGGTSCGPGSRG